jgi:hypothetical protein
MNFETHQQRDAMMCFTSAATCAVLRMLRLLLQLLLLLLLHRRFVS